MHFKALSPIARLFVPVLVNRPPPIWNEQYPSRPIEAVNWLKTLIYNNLHWYVLSIYLNETVVLATLMVKSSDKPMI